MSRKLRFRQVGGGIERVLSAHGENLGFLHGQAFGNHQKAAILYRGFARDHSLFQRGRESERLAATICYCVTLWSSVSPKTGRTAVNGFKSGTIRRFLRFPGKPFRPRCQLQRAQLAELSGSNRRVLE